MKAKDFRPEHFEKGRSFNRIDFNAYVQASDNLARTAYTRYLPSVAAGLLLGLLFSKGIGGFGGNILALVCIFAGLIIGGIFNVKAAKAVNVLAQRLGITKEDVAIARKHVKNGTFAWTGEWEGQSREEAPAADNIPSVVSRESQTENHTVNLEKTNTGNVLKPETKIMQASVRQPPVLRPESAKQVPSEAVSSFRLEVSNKYSAYGGIYAEGKIQEGGLSVGNSVYVYSKSGELKYENAKVIAINNEQGIRVNSVSMGQGNYAAIRLNRAPNFGDIEHGDIISSKKLQFEESTQKPVPPPEKPLPQPKTYNDPDRRKHITMATNDLAAMCGAGTLTANREWVRNVGQDLYDAHGFQAMQEVFINIKTRYPGAQSQLSGLWDGVGGWADRDTACHVKGMLSQSIIFAPANTDSRMA